MTQQPAALATSPYITGGPELDDLLLLDDHENDELWRRHSFDQIARADRVVSWTERKSLSVNDVVADASVRASISDFISDVAKRQHRFSSPSVPHHRHSFPSPASTTTTTSSATFRPWSSGGSTASSLADDSSGSPLTTTNVRFVGVAKIDAHCVYTLQVDTCAEQFVVNKRYSQFRAFRQQLLALLQQTQHCGNGPCKQLQQQLAQLKFPRRRLLQQWKRGADLAVARERLLLLQRFTDAMLRVYRAAPRRQLRCCLNTNCAAMEAVRKFLEISARDDTVVLTPPQRRAELLRVQPHPIGGSNTTTTTTLTNSDNSSSVESRGDSSLGRSSDASSRARQSRGFPPPTRVSLAAEPDHQFDQLYTITEDSELVHLHT